MSAQTENFPLDRQSPEQPLKFDTDIDSDSLFTPEHVSKLFISSFRFSQGNPILQAQIFKYLQESHGDQLTTELIDQGVSLATPKISKFVTKGHNHRKQDQASVDSWIAKEQDAWTSNLEDAEFTENPRDPYDPYEVLTAILLQDAKHSSAYGRPNRPDDVATHSRGESKYSSQFIAYGLLARDTGMSEYNTMFAGLVDSLTDIPDEVQDTIDSPTVVSPAERQILVPILPIFVRHFTTYPDDVANITPHGLKVLQDRFKSEELEQCGIPPTL